MKTNKIQYLAIAAALLVSAAFVSCNRENELRGLRINVENYKTDDNKSVVSGTNVHWNDGDAIRINGDLCHVSVDGSTVAVSDFEGNASSGIFAYSPYSMTVTNDLTTRPTVTFPSRFQSSFNGDNQIIDLPMAAYATADATSITFKHLSAAVLVRVRNNTANTLYIDSVKVRSSIFRLCGTRSINLTDGELGISAVGNSAPENEKSVTVYFNDNSASVSTGSYKEVQVPIFPVNASGMFQINVYAHNANIEGMPITVSLPHYFTHAITPPAAARNQMFVAQISIDPSSSRVTSPYAFSVSSTKKVYFSKGNLTYTPSTSTWAFHTNQYDVANTSNIPSYYSASGTTPIDLFGWCTSGYQVSNRPNYMPYATATNGGMYGFNDGTTDLTIANHGDWGCNMTSAAWRTPTNAEWDYVYDRSVNLRTRATVNGYPGLILFPDTWNASDCGVSYTADAQNFTTNYISGSDWTAMQNYGAVFLPAAGYRAGTDLYSDMSSGFYWTSEHDIYSENVSKAARISFSKNARNFTSAEYRSRGMCVRLVTDAN